MEVSNTLTSSLHDPFQLLNAGLITTYSDWNYGPICSPFFRIYWVQEGEANIRIGDKVHLLRPGHRYFIPAYVRHYAESNNIFTHAYIQVL